jgi:hypothetical protein
MRQQRHVAAAGVDRGLQIGVALMVAGAAKHQHADIRAARAVRCVGSSWWSTEDRVSRPSVSGPVGGAGLCPSATTQHRIATLAASHASRGGIEGVSRRPVRKIVLLG